MFNAETTRLHIVRWIRNWFEKNGPNSCAIVGISGGKDSTIVAGLCIEALGKNRVIGVRMPCFQQHDSDVAIKVCEHFDITHIEYNIGSVFNEMHEMISVKIGTNDQMTTNMPARIRMTTLYAVATVFDGRVANTSNLSEDWVGYATKFGDAAGDFAPIAKLTVSEVKEIGRVMDIPNEFIDKVPEDGLSGKTDEDNLGFTYEVLDRYIRTGEIDDKEIEAKICRLHIANQHKLEVIPAFEGV